MKTYKQFMSEMAVAKATHIGSCQICGSTQKLPGDILAKHGYTKRFGWFEGTCAGSDCKPFEKSFKRLEKVVKDVARQVVELKKSRANILKNTEFALVKIRERGGAFGSGKYKRVKIIIKPEGSFWEEDKTKKEYPITVNRPLNKGDIPKLIKKQNDEYVKLAVDPQIRQMEMWIKESEKKIRNWEEKPLAPVNPGLNLKSVTLTFKLFRPIVPEGNASRVKNLLLRHPKTDLFIERYLGPTIKRMKSSGKLDIDFVVKTMGKEIVGWGARMLADEINKEGGEYVDGTDVLRGKQRLPVAQFMTDRFIMDLSTGKYDGTVKDFKPSKDINMEIITKE